MSSEGRNHNWDYAAIGTPEDFLASWSASRGNLRRFFEDHAAAPINDAAQRQAGEAAATQAVAAIYGMELNEFNAGVDAVAGAARASCRRGGAPGLVGV